MQAMSLLYDIMLPSVTQWALYAPWQFSKSWSWSGKNEYKWITKSQSINGSIWFIVIDEHDFLPEKQGVIFLPEADICERGPCANNHQGGH